MALFVGAIFDSLTAGLVALGVGVAVGWVVGYRLRRKLDPQASPARILVPQLLILAFWLAFFIYLDNKVTDSPEHPTQPST